MSRHPGLLLAVVALLGLAVTATAQTRGRIPLLIDSDANNEVDDQHALAYALLDRETFDVVGITVNATRGGGDVRGQMAEAERVVRLVDRGDVPIVPGADGDFATIRSTITNADFDGGAAVDFIIKEAHRARGERLVLLPIGKLTNIALALLKDPSIATKVRIVWLGSNYPEPGEYNQENDLEAVRYVLSVDVPFEIATVRYGTGTGTDAVRVTPAEIAVHVAGRGPTVAPVAGRHGDNFTTFGDYAANLFANVSLNGTPPGRALFDMAAVAIVKNPSWARSRVQPAPALVGERWEDRPGNARTVTIWEHFDRDAIVNDFFRVMARATPEPR